MKVCKVVLVSVYLSKQAGRQGDGMNAMGMFYSL
jgi:hypothetical protein